MSSTTAIKRKATTEGADAPQPKTKAALVPRVVPVDMDGDDIEPVAPIEVVGAAATPQAAAAMPPSMPSGPALPSKVDWALINDRDILKTLLTPPSTGCNKKGNSVYLTFDVAGYSSRTGQNVNLGKYNHLTVEGPYMCNTFGVSSKVQAVGQNPAHSICFDVADASVDKEVTKFAQFLALCDYVCFQICVEGVQRWDAINAQVGWVSDCTGADGTVDKRRLEATVARYFNGALRQSDKNKKDRTLTYKTVTWEEEAKRFRVPNQFYFKTKVYGKTGNEKLLELPCYNSKNQRVYWNAERDVFKVKDQGDVDMPVLAAGRGTFVKPQVELPSINFVQKEFFATWVTKKIKYQTAKEVARTYEKDAGADVCDFDDQSAPVRATDDDLRRATEQESCNLHTMSVPTDD